MEVSDSTEESSSHLSPSFSSSSSSLAEHDTLSSDDKVSSQLEEDTDSLQLMLVDDTLLVLERLEADAVVGSCKDEDDSRHFLYPIGGVVLGK